MIRPGFSPSFAAAVLWVALLGTCPWAWAAPPAIVARTGDVAGDGTVLGGEVTSCSVSRGGDLVFRGRTAAGAPAIWRVGAGGGGLEALAVVGGAVPSFESYGVVVDSATFTELGVPAVGDAGEAVFTAKLGATSGVNVSTDETVWLSPRGTGPLSLLARELDFAFTERDASGAPVLDDPPWRNDRFRDPVAGRGGQVVFAGRFRSPLELLGTNYRSALFHQRRPSTDGTLPFGSRPPVVTFAGDTIVTGGEDDEIVAVREVGVPDPTGAFVFVAESMREGALVESVWWGDGHGVPHRLVSAGDAVPGGGGRTFTSFSAPVFAGPGSVVFWAGHGLSGIEAPGGFDGEGIYRIAVAGGGPVPVLVAGDAAPGGEGASVLSLGNPAADRSGGVVLRGETADASGEPSGVAEIWKINAPGAGAHRVARAGDPAPGLDGATFADFGDPRSNPGGQVVMVAWANHPGTASRTPAAYRLTPGTNALGKLVAVGDDVEAEPGVPVEVTGFVLGDIGESGEIPLGLALADGTAAVGVVETPDTVPPPAPSGLVQTSGDLSSVGLRWVAADDNVGVSHFTVRRDGVAVAAVSDLVQSFTDTGLNDGQRYDYTVEAVDLAGNVSTPSAPLAVTVPVRGPDFIVDDRDPGHSLPVNTRWGLMFDVAAHDGRFRMTDGVGDTAAWKASLPVTARYEVAVAGGGFNLFDRAAEFTVHAADGAVTRVLDQTRAAGDPLWQPLGVFAFDEGTPARVTLRRTGADPYLTVADAVRWRMIVTDSAPPGKPGNLSVEWETSEAVSLDWAAASDDFGVAEYRVLRNGVEVGRTATTSFVDRGLVPGSSPSYKVVAVDYLGQESAAPATAQLTLPRLGETPFVIDDNTEGFALVTPGAFFRSFDPAFYGGARWVSNTTGASASWSFQPPLAAYFQLEVFAPGGELDRSVPYRVTSGGEEWSFDVNQRGDGVRQWLPVGAFWLEAGSPATVSFTRDGADPFYTVADAVRWRVIIENDTGPPSPPSVATATWTDREHAHITWPATTDDFAVARYEIYRDGERVGSVPGLSFDDGGLAPGVAYRYSVAAVDYLGQVSAPRAAPVVVMPTPVLVEEIDHGDPGYSESGFWYSLFTEDAVGGSRRTTGTLGAIARWETTVAAAGLHEVRAFHNSTIHERSAIYRVYVGGELVATRSIDQRADPQGGLGQVLTLLPIEAAQSVRVEVERDGNDPYHTTADAVRIVRLVADHLPPTVPADLTARWTWTSGPSVDLTWSPVEDDGLPKPVRYLLWKDGAEFMELEGTAFSDWDVIPGESPTYAISAVSVTGLQSGVSPPVKVSLPVAAPSAIAVVDNSDAAFSHSGGWWLSEPPDAFGAPGSRTARMSDSPGASATWQAVLPATGWYQVEASIPSATLDTAANYTIETAAGPHALTANQLAASPGWLALGSFWFNASTPARVTVTHDAGGDWRPTVADAVRWTPLEVPAGSVVRTLAHGPGSLAVEVWSDAPLGDVAGLLPALVLPGGGRVSPASTVRTSDHTFTATFELPAGSAGQMADLEFAGPAGLTTAESAVFWGESGADFDRDGVRDLLEIASGGDPADPAVGLALQPELVWLADGTCLFRFYQWQARPGTDDGGTTGTGFRARGLMYSVEVWDPGSGAGWRALRGTPVVETVAPGPLPGLDRIDLRIPAHPSQNSSAAMVRLRVSTGP